MIYYIDDNEFPLKENLQETYKGIIAYLNEMSSIVVDENGIPLDELEIMNYLEKQENPTFKTKLIIDYENEVLNNILQFSKELLMKIDDLKMINNKEILLSFFELSDTLLELSNADSYFSINKIVRSEIELTVKQAEQKIKEGDYTSIIDIIELIYSEWLEEFIEELESRRKMYQ